MTRRRNYLIAISSRPLTLIVTTGSDRTIDVEIDDGCRIDIRLYARLRARDRDLDVLEIEEGRYERITVCGRLLEGCVSILRTPEARTRECSSAAYAVRD